MEHKKRSPASALKIALGILAGAWLMMGAPTGWLYDLGAGTGTGQGQRPAASVQTLAAQADVSEAWAQGAPVTAAKEGLIACPLLRLRDSGQAGEHSFKRGTKRTVVIPEYIHIDERTGPLRRLFLDLLAHGYYNGYYLAPLSDGSYVCVYFDDYLALWPGGTLPTGYVRPAGPEEQRMLYALDESYEVDWMFVLDMYRHGKVSQPLDLALRAAAGLMLLAAGSAAAKRVRRAARRRDEGRAQP